MARLDTLAAVTSVPGQITRLYLTKEHRAAAKLVRSWMRDAGMIVTTDAAGTLSGRVEGTAKGARTLLIGSHIDSVRNAGRFDGCLGVVLAVEVLAELVRIDHKLPYSVEVLAFGNGSGMRYPATFLGSQALAGRLSLNCLDLVDDAGVELRAALTAFGCDVDKLGEAERRPQDLLGFIEVHVEQGAALEQEDVPIGVVTTVSGASRYRVEVSGTAGHAGALPMAERHDALAAAAEMILAIERIARDTAGLVMTVGTLQVRPGAPYVVPAEVTFSLDVRSPVDRTRRRGTQDVEREFRLIARRRQVSVSMSELHNEQAATCDPRFIRLFTSAAERLDCPTMGLPTGSRHDSLAIASLCPIGMLLVRSQGAVSQHPDEDVKADDIEIAARVLMETLCALSPNGRNLS